MNPVLYVILNGSLKMSAGKAAAQAVHAAMMLPEQYRAKFSSDNRPYKRTVIILEAKTGTQLDRIAEYLDKAGLHYETYIDEGKNEIDAFSMTALAVETIDVNDEEALEIFSALPLFRDRELQDRMAFNSAIATAELDTESTQPPYTQEQRNIAHLLAESRELRNLWSETESDIIELKSQFNRFLNLKWYKRLFVKPNSWEIIKDKNETEEYNIRGRDR